MLGSVSSASMSALKVAPSKRPMKPWVSCSETLSRMIASSTWSSSMVIVKKSRSSGVGSGLPCWEAVTRLSPSATLMSVGLRFSPDRSPEMASSKGVLNSSSVTEPAAVGAAPMPKPGVVIAVSVTETASAPLSISSFVTGTVIVPAPSIRVTVSVTELVPDASVTS